MSLIGYVISFTFFNATIKEYTKKCQKTQNDWVYATSSER